MMQTRNIININSMQGLGDNIYQRPYVKELAKLGDVYINTSWPELYSDIPGVYFVRPSTTLRTQKKNYEQSKTNWIAAPSKIDKQVNFGYGRDLDKTTIPASMAKASGIKHEEMDLPKFFREFKTDKPIAFVRPVTERKEWLNSARNPDPKYIEQTIEELKKTHHIISVSDVKDGQEWKVGDCYADTRFEEGELDFNDMMALFQSSDIVIGGIGWIVPAAIADKKKAIIIGGGQLGHNHIDRLTDKSMNLSNIHYISPEDGCFCVNMRHNCNKEIRGFDEWLLSVLAILKASKEKAA